VIYKMDMSFQSPCVVIQKKAFSRNTCGFLNVAPAMMSHSGAKLVLANLKSQHVQLVMKLVVIILLSPKHAVISTFQTLINVLSVNR
jgi:hypothetical protein